MEQSEKFALKWNNYQTHLSSRFQQLEGFTDVTLYCEDKKIQAHKVILAACSPYFQDVFEDMLQFQSAIIFRDVKYDDLAAIVRFIYTGEAEITQEMLPSFIKTAHLLKMHGLTNMNFNQKVQSSMCSKRPISPDEPKQIPSPITEIVEPENAPLAYCEIDIEQEQPSVKRIKDEPVEDSISSPAPSEPLNINTGLIDGTEDVLEMDREMAQSWLPASMFPPEEMQEGHIKEEESTTSGLDQSEHKRYECQTCGKGFTTYDRLRVHTDVHEGLTRCTICGQILSRKDSLRRHMKIKHPVIPYAPVNKSDNVNNSFLGGSV